MCIISDDTSQRLDIGTVGEKKFIYRAVLS